MDGGLYWMCADTRGSTLIVCSPRGALRVCWRHGEMARPIEWGEDNRGRDSEEGEDIEENEDIEEAERDDEVNEEEAAFIRGYRRERQRAFEEE